MLNCIIGVDGKVTRREVSRDISGGSKQSHQDRDATGFHVRRVSAVPHSIIKKHSNLGCAAKRQDDEQVLWATRYRKLKWPGPHQSVIDKQDSAPDVFETPDEPELPLKPVSSSVPAVVARPDV